MRDQTIMTSSNGNIFRVTGPLCGEFTGPGEFPAQSPVTRSFNVFFDLRLNKRLSRQSRRRWFETSSSSLWRHYYAKNRLFKLALNDLMMPWHGNTSLLTRPVDSSRTGSIMRSFGDFNRSMLLNKQSCWRDMKGNGLHVTLLLSLLLLSLLLLLLLLLLLS